MINNRLNPDFRISIQLKMADMVERMEAIMVAALMVGNVVVTKGVGDMD